MWEQTIQSLQENGYEVWLLIGTWMANHLLHIIFIVVGAEITYRVLSRTLSKIIHKTTHRPDLFPTELDRKKRVKTLDSLVNAVVRVSVFVIAVMMIISELGINTGPLVASAGVIGVALGFGAQSLIRDFMSGFFIITENQFRVGDIIEIATNVSNVRISGTVEAITIRTTVIRDLDGKLHHVPNGNIIVTTNMTMNFAKLNEELVIEQDTDLAKLEHVINHTGEELAADPTFKHRIIEPPYFARIDRINNDGLVVKIFGKTTPGEQWSVKGELYKRLTKALEKNHIELAQTRITVSQAKRRA